MSTAVAPARIAEVRSGRGELAAAFAAVRARLGLVVLLFALAAVAWWSTADRMAGMDAGPGTHLGALGWFLGVWVVMSAMMFPSLAPTVALYANMTRRSGLSRPLLFTSGYLLVWGTAGLAAYGLFQLGSSLSGGDLAWHAGGCLGCCWALMAALFALGVMSLTWMAFVAALIALEKTIPWRRAATWGTAAVLLVLAIAVLASPQSVPGLVVPGGSDGAMNAMR